MKSDRTSIYRAIVMDNEDPQLWGRIRVKCPKVLGEYLSAWCMPCVSLLGDDSGIFRIPKVGDLVWIMFEEGDLKKPVYIGGCTRPARTPLAVYNDNDLVIKTKNGSIKITENKVIIEGNLEVRGNVVSNNINI